jgi:hypothetical protein
MCFRALLFTLVFVAISTTTWTATIGLDHEITFSVPGLENPITQVKFNDIDGDSFPEALVTDGTTLVLYSVFDDSVLFSAATSWLAFSYPPEMLAPGDMELADVNRDSIGDIVLAYGDWGNIRTLLFDGASGFQEVDSMRIDFSIGVQGWSGLVGLNVVDINRDDYNELMLAYNVIELIFPFTEGTTGATRFYHSFPDSVAFESSPPFRDVAPFATDENTTYCLATAFKSRFTEYHGYMGTSEEFYPVILSDNGTVSSGVFPDPATMSANTYSASYEARVPECFGNLRGVPSELNVLLNFNWSLYYRDDYPWDTTASSTYEAEGGQRMYTMLDPTHAKLIWSTDEALEGSYLYHPDFPGYYFRMNGDTLFQHKGVDGSIYQTLYELPDGSKSWDYPFEDGESRLIAVDGNQVSFYKLDITTGVDDDQTQTDALPTAFALAQNYPNPFNPSTSIEFSLAQRSEVTISIYNVLGQKVRTLLNEPRPAGSYTVERNATDESGETVASGVYLYRLQTEELDQTKKMLLLK